MSNSGSEEQQGGRGIGDEDLPEDLRPDDSPLAGGLEDGETAGDLDPGELLEEGKKPDEWDDDQED